MVKNFRSFFVLLLALMIVPIATLPAEAAKYTKLKSQGFKTGKLTKNAAGISGWYVVKGADRYFCRMLASVAYVGKTGMIGFTGSGRQIKISRKAYESRTGGPNKDIPQLADLKRGRLNARDVSRCRKQR